MRSPLIGVALLAALVVPSAAMTELGTFMGLEPQCPQVLGSNLTHVILSDAEIKDAFSQNNGAAFLAQLDTLKAAGVDHFVLTIRFPDPQDEKMDRIVPPGPERDAAFLLIERLLIGTNGRIDYLKLNDAPLGGGSGAYPPERLEEGFEWLAALALHARVVINANNLDTKIMSPGLTGLGGIIKGQQPAPSVSGLITFAGLYTDALDIHLHVRNVADLEARVDWVRARMVELGVSVPLTAMKWSQSQDVVDDWLREDPARGQFVHDAYLNRVEAGRWNEFMSTVPLEPDFIARAYDSLSRRGFLHAVWAPLYQYGSAEKLSGYKYDMTALTAQKTALPIPGEDCSPRNAVLSSDFQGLSERIYGAAPPPAATALGTFMASGSDCPRELGAKAVRKIYSDYAIQEAFDNNSRAFLDEIDALRAAGVEQFVFTIRFPTDPQDSQKMDRIIPPGPERQAAFALVERLLRETDGRVSYLQLNNEPLSGPGRYPPQSYEEAIEWLTALAIHVRSVIAANNLSTKIMAPAVTGLHNVHLGAEPPALEKSAISGLITFAARYTDALDVHLYVAHRQDLEARADWLLNRMRELDVSVPLTTTEWSQAKALDPWFLGNPGLEDFMSRAYLERVSQQDWAAFIGSAPLEADFIGRAYESLRSRGFLHACYASMLQYGSAQSQGLFPIEATALIVQKTVRAEPGQACGPKNPGLFADFQNLAARLNDDAQPPLVSLTSPRDGALVSGSVALAASASDNVGVVGVTFYADGQPVGPEDILPPYEALWDSTRLADGPHVLSASARDGAGHVATSSITVTSNNAGRPGTTLGTFMAFGPACPQELGSRATRKIFDDYSIQAAFDANNRQFLDEIDALRAAGVEQFVFTIRFPTDPQDSQRMDRIIPPGPQRDAAFALVERLLIETNGRIEYLQLNNEPLGGPGAYPPEQFEEAMEWLTALAVHARSVIAGNNLGTKIMAPGITGLGEIHRGGQPPPSVVQAISELIFFAGAHTDALDLHLHVNNQADLEARADWVLDKMRALNVAVPLTTMEWSQSHALDEWLRAVPQRAQFVQNAYLNPVTQEEWTAFVGQAPLEPDFIGRTYDSLNSRGFLHACYAPLHQYGSADRVGAFKFNVVALNPWKTVQESQGRCSPRTEPLFSDFQNLAARLNEGDSLAPRVEITTPQDAAVVSGLVAIQATATDDVGVVGVRFFIDGQPLGEEDRQAPYEALWDSTLTLDGRRIVSASARDAAGRVGVSSVTVIVDNQGQGEPPAAPGAPILAAAAYDAHASWRASTGGSGALRYRLEVSTSADFSALWWSKDDIEGTSAAIAGLMPLTRYHARVKARDGLGRWSDFSAATEAQTLEARPGDYYVVAYPGQAVALEHPAGARLEVPVAGISEQVTLRVRQLAPGEFSLGPGMTQRGPVFDLQPEGLRFQEPARLSVPFDDNGLPLGLYTFDTGAGRWTRLGTDAGLGRIAGELEHFSIYGAMLDPKDFRNSTILEGYAYPNPLVGSGQTLRLKVRLAGYAQVSAKVFNAAGEQLATIGFGEASAQPDGWLAEASWAAGVPSGVYYVIMESKNESGPQRKLQKVAIIK